MSYKANISQEEIDALPRFIFNGKIIILDNPDLACKTCENLCKQQVLGFDTESKAVFKKGVKNKPALIQIATEYEVYLFRINKIGIPDVMIEILTRPEIVKIGVAIHQDIKELQQIRTFKQAGFIDLQPYSGKFGIIDNGLKKLAANVLGVNISKSQRLSDWNAEKLTESQLEYAATDAWISRAIYMKLRELE